MAKFTTDELVSIYNRAGGGWQGFHRVANAIAAAAGAESEWTCEACVSSEPEDS